VEAFIFFECILNCSTVFRIELDASLALLGYELIDFDFGPRLKVRIFFCNHAAPPLIEQYGSACRVVEMQTELNPSSGSAALTHA
jgi:hypothetical protein